MRPSGLALGWQVDEGTVPGTCWVSAPCPARCGGSCGIAFELAADRRIVELHVAVGGGAVFLALEEDPDAQSLSDPRGYRTRLLRIAAEGSLIGREELAPDLADAAARIGLAADGEIAFLARDLMHLDHPNGAALRAIGHLFAARSNGWEVREVTLGVDALTGRLRFALHLLAEVFTHLRRDLQRSRRGRGLRAGRRARLRRARGRSDRHRRTRPHARRRLGPIAPRPARRRA